MERKNINRGYKKLEVWNDAVALYVMVVKCLTNLPFVHQKSAANIIDAAQSVSRNIAEGYCRKGLKEYLNETYKLIFGSQPPQHTFMSQTLGGSGALRLAGEFLDSQEINRTIYLPNPTWPNHKLIFKRSGLKIEQYPYFDALNHRLDFAGLCIAIQDMPKNSIILLHGCCHNPTGIDPTMEEWKEIFHLITKHELIPFFDFAYQGFGQSIEQDAEPIRYFASQEKEFFVANSYSKNMGLYGERAGSLIYFSESKEIANKVGSNFKQIIRGSYSNPPRHGAEIVATILQNPGLKSEWMHELANMKERINSMRKALVANLLAKGNQDFSFLNHQKGIFSYCGLTQDQVHLLRQDHGIYMPSDGRINVAGLNWQNMDYVIDAILTVL